MLLFVDSRHYYDAKDYAEEMDEKYGLDCYDCFNYSGGLVWVSEFGSKDHVGYSCVLDMETGTGVMYRFTANNVSCRCDAI